MSDVKKEKKLLDVTREWNVNPMANNKENLQDTETVATLKMIFSSRWLNFHGHRIFIENRDTARILKRIN